MTTKDGGERLEALRKKLRDDPRSLGFVELAEELNRLGQNAEASEVAQRGLLSHPDSVAGRLALAVAEAEQDHIREALEQIKRALLIDQENPKALALMGRILLKKGLAKRAVQFLSHAVKLDPKSETYVGLLADARKAAKSSKDRTPVPVFDGSNVPDSGSPWEEGAAAAEAEHTVFDPEALKKLRAKDKQKKLDDALANLPSMENGDNGEEPTKFVPPKSSSELPPPRRVGEEETVDPREEPTKFAAENPLDKRKKAKMGGSAKDFSQMMKKADVDGIREEAERRIRSSPPKPPVSDLNLEAMQAEETHQEGNLPKPAPKAPSVERELRTSSDRPKETSNKQPPPPPPEKKPASVKAPSEKKPAPPPEPKAPSVKKPPSVKAPSEKKPAPNKAIGPMATQMVDDALWELLGGGPGEEKGKRPTPDAPPEKPAAPAGKQPAKVKADKKPAKKAEPAAKPGGPMVVRTSERLGTWTGFAILFILCVTTLWIGYWITVSQFGAQAPEVASEELKGLAADLEAGGLAKLLAAEDKTIELARQNPDLDTLMTGALAEIYARRYAYFGRDPALLEKAKAQMAKYGREQPSLELLTAMTLLSTGAASRDSIDAELARTLKEYKSSPKAWVMRARLARLDGRDDDEIKALYHAYAINPQHRLTLLELARWHGRQGGYGTAFGFFDQLQDKYPLDVEGAIERYVLGQITGKDPAESQAVSTLAGLVRDELPEVAKDETGRAALAFAVSKFASGDLAAGLEELGKAEAAFESSAVFKAALGSVFVAAGEWERAREQYRKAHELQPASTAHRIGMARATLGERTGAKVDPEAFRKSIGKAAGRGTAELPFGTVKFEMGRFALVSVTPDAGLFPEGEYAAIAAKGLEGADLQKALEAASLRALAKRKMKAKAFDEAITLLRESSKLIDDARTDTALGTVYVAKKEYGEAIRILSNTVDSDERNMRARLALARAYLGKNDQAKALEVLDGISDDVISPDALLIVARLKLERADYEGAAARATKLAELQPSNPAAHVVRGEALHRVGKFDESVEAFRAALKAKPRLGREVIPKGLDKLSPVALLGLGRAELDKNDRRAVILMRASLKAEEAPDEGHFFLGEALVKRKKTRREGKKQLQRYMQLASSGELRDRADQLLKQRR